MAGRRHRLSEDEIDFFIRGCDHPVGRFRGPIYPEAPGRFKYEPYRGPGHVALCEALGSGQPARCWYTSLERRIDFEVSREDFVLGPPGCFSDWFVEVTRVAEAGPA